jgi:hypothetical protein
MRLLAPLVSAALILAAPLARAQDTAGSDLAGGSPGGIMFNTSISLNLPLTAPDRAGRLAEEEGHRKDLYDRSVRECAILLESIASACTITGISVSSQINSNPGQADYLYVSSNIVMQVALK